jgi:hypothetical protein
MALVKSFAERLLEGRGRGMEGIESALGARAGEARAEGWEEAR